MHEIFIVFEDKVPDFSVENTLPGITAGIDEVGYGAFAGPVISAISCFTDMECNIIGINDSKKLSEAKRNILFEQIIASPCKYSIAMASVEEINEMNILQATKLSVIRALKNLQITVDSIIIDGIHTIENIKNVHPLKKGDSLSISVATASIIAKVTRDKMMRELHLLHPEYNWKQNKGYGTREHLDVIENLGTTKFHRTKFVESYFKNKKNNSRATII